MKQNKRSDETSGIASASARGTGWSLARYSSAVAVPCYAVVVGSSSVDLGALARQISWVIVPIGQ